MKEETYTQAFERLQKIVSQIESGELEIDQLADMIKEANKLIAFCNDKLTKADQEILKNYHRKRNKCNYLLLFLQSIITIRKK